MLRTAARRDVRSAPRSRPGPRPRRPGTAQGCVGSAVRARTQTRAPSPSGPRRASSATPVGRPLSSAVEYRKLLDKRKLLIQHETATAWEEKPRLWGEKRDDKIPPVRAGWEEKVDNRPSLGALRTEGHERPPLGALRTEHARGPLGAEPRPSTASRQTVARPLSGIGRRPHTATNRFGACERGVGASDLPKDVYAALRDARAQKERDARANVERETRETRDAALRQVREAALRDVRETVREERRERAERATRDLRGDRKDPPRPATSSGFSRPPTALSDGRKEKGIGDYTVGKQIGQGAYAVVRFGVQKDNGAKVAVKVYERCTLMDPQRRKSVYREIKIMQRLKHPNLVSYIHSIDTAKQVYIVMEYLGGGSLHSYIKKRPQRRLEEHSARRFFGHLCRGLKYLHSWHIAHRDVKLENTLMDEQGVLKLIDFGFSTVVPAGKKIRVFCGTPSYMAPEIVARREHTGMCTDVWAAGVMLYAMLYGCFPFKAATDKELYRKIQRAQFVFPEGNCSPGARQCVLRILVVDKRPTISDVLADTWAAEEKHSSSTSSTTTASSRRPSISEPDEKEKVIPPPKAAVPASKPLEVDETAVAKLERLGYGRDEIVAQLQDENSHLYRLYFRFLKALNAWET